MPRSTSGGGPSYDLTFCFWPAQRGPAIDLITVDYNCTDEMQAWDAVIKQVELSRETPSGRGVYVNTWVWDGFVEGMDSGYVRESHGTAPYVERYALDGSPAGGFFVLENSVLHPVTEGAPKIRLDVEIRLAYNADGDIVVDRASYTTTATTIAVRVQPGTAWLGSFKACARRGPGRGTAPAPCFAIASRFRPRTPPPGCPWLLRTACACFSRGTWLQYRNERDSV